AVKVAQQVVNNVLQGFTYGGYFHAVARWAKCVPCGDFVGAGGCVWQLHCCSFSLLLLVLLVVVVGGVWWSPDAPPRLVLSSDCLCFLERFPQCRQLPQFLRHNRAPYRRPRCQSLTS